MKIIFRGTPDAEKTYQGTCHKCQSIIEFKRDEAEYVSDQRDGDYLKIECPVCKMQNITVDVNKYQKPGD